MKVLVRVKELVMENSFLRILPVPLQNWNCAYVSSSSSFCPSFFLFRFYPVSPGLYLYLSSSFYLLSSLNLRVILF